MCHYIKNTSFCGPFLFYQCALFMPLTNIIISSYHLHMCAILSGFSLINFTNARFLLLDKYFFCHTHMHALLGGHFYAMYANMRHCVVFIVSRVPVLVACGLKKILCWWSGATHLSWHLASVTCLGVLIWWLMSETHYNQVSA